MVRSWEPLRTLPVRIAVLVGLALAVLLPAGIQLERVLSARLLESGMTSQRQALANGGTAASVRIRLAESRTARLAAVISQATEQANLGDADAFRQRTRRAGDGTTRLAGRFDPDVDAMVWLPAEHPRTTTWFAILGRAQSALGLLGSAMLGEGADDIWFMTVRGGELMYMPSDPTYADAPAPPGYDGSAWVTPASPGVNPSGAPIWLPAQASPRPPLWYASVIAPVIRGGEFIGSVGLDLSISAIFAEFDQASTGAASAHLIVEGGHLIVHGHGAGFDRASSDTVLVRSLPEPLRDSLEALVARARTSEPGKVAESAADGRVMLATRLAGPDWVTVALIDRAAAVAPLAGPLRTMRRTLAAVLGLLLLAGTAVATADARRQRRLDRIQARAMERFNRLFSMLPVAVLLTRADSDEVREVNEAAVRLMDRPREALLGTTAADLGLRPAGDPADFTRAIREHGTVADVSGTFVNGGGRTVEFLLAARVIELGDEPHVLHVVQDLSAQRDLESRLAQAHRLEAIGRLAGGVAHDFNNLLTAVIGYGELLEASLEPDDRRATDVGEILKAARRGAKLTRQLLDFARQQRAAPRPVDLNDLILGLEGMLKPLLGADIVITTDLCPGIPPVLADPGQLEQVVINLAVNSRDAMPGGGALLILTRDDGRWVVLEVTDTGKGIPETERAHIFEPFFTTKAVGKGTGLGLATCYGIVHHAGGMIDCESTPGYGTTFRVRLPRYQPSAAESPVAGEAEARIPATTASATW